MKQYYAVRFVSGYSDHFDAYTDNEGLLNKYIKQLANIDLAKFSVINCGEYDDESTLLSECDWLSEENRLEPLVSSDKTVMIVVSPRLWNDINFLIPPGKVSDVISTIIGRFFELFSGLYAYVPDSSEYSDVILRMMECIVRLDLDDVENPLSTLDYVKFVAYLWRWDTFYE